VWGCCAGVRCAGVQLDTVDDSVDGGAVGSRFVQRDGLRGDEINEVG
jgi:hypothetical protein